MTLTELLRIDPSLVGAGQMPGLRFVEREWGLAGKATEPAELAEFLDSAITRCASLRIRYPAILLKRRKQILRGEFRPDPVPDVKVAAGDPPGVCTECRGRGFQSAGSTGSLCMACLGTGRAKGRSQ